MSEKIVVVALGHRALGTTLPEQKVATKAAAKAIADLVEEGAKVVISHSNGPQIGMIHTAMNEFGKTHPDYTFAPMSVCSAMSQGYIGFDLQNAIKDDLISTVYFWYVHNLNEKNNPKVREELTAMQINSNAAVKTLFPENKVDVFAIEVGNETIEKWYNASSSQITVVEKMTVDTVKKGFELVGNKWKAYVTAVTADWVKEQYCRYNDDIFSGNPRTYLGSGKKKNKINLGIIQTITEQPNNFWAYNNGITALVNDYSIENDLNTGEEKLTISGITIINGAQTTGAVSSVTEVGKALIPIRFIVCEDSSIINEIINNNNKQNEIIASDLRSNDKVQFVL